ncbi:unnamed protein product [Pelagomonas calceolata]|uniref:ER membrane protein complex subunit 3 n=1 Tax=Pelagomonas calceolata TaxID=35677 RepID=A0A7S4A988_9STRA|nr:unnamed protein product [Pelagomonas calceolata]|mmetsp:Transcript_10290/g.30184  ORF Transcript_10290/g.30184 Transcript_10290/m.30184 type:complete len:283 (-) Transcript_10290:35-883(-)
MAATAPQTPLLLDPSIRDWVVLPMVAIMVLMNLMRHYAQQAMKDSKPIDATEMQQKQLLSRAARIRTRGSRLLPSESFNARKAYFVDKDKGLLAKKPKKATKKPMDPMAMMDGMKGNMLYMVPNMLMMTVISFFFSGFVLVKVPFPVTQRFKQMLQRGVDLATLDTSYVSSLSWYFLLMFGLRGFLRVVLGEDPDAMDANREMQMQMGMGMGGGGPQGFDAAPAYKHEREELQMAQHSWVLEDAELQLCGAAVAARVQNAALGARPVKKAGARVKKVRRVKK